MTKYNNQRGYMVGLVCLLANRYGTENKIALVGS